MNENRVARKNRFPKFHLVRTREIANATRSLRQFEQKNTGHLRHRFYLHYSRHDWMTGEMPLKKRFVNRDGFYGRNFIFDLEADDPVNHQKRVAVRKDLHPFASVQTGIAYWDRARCAHRASLGLLACDCPGQIRIRSMAGLYRHHMTSDTAPDKREIADDVENFVPDECVGKTQGLLAENRLAAHDNRIFEAAALDQIFLHERLNILIENKGSRRGDLAFENCGCDFHRQKLREPIVWSGLCARDAKRLIRQQNKQRARFRFDVHRVAHVEKCSRLLLGRDTGFPDQIDVSLGAAIADWRFVCVHLDNNVVHAHRPQRRQNVLDCVHAHRAFADGRGALDGLQIFDFRVDGWLILQILAFKFDSVIDWRGLKFEGDFCARVQSGAAKAGGFGYRILKLGCGGHCGLSNRYSELWPDVVAVLAAASTGSSSRRSWTAASVHFNSNSPQSKDIILLTFEMRNR